MTPGNRRVREPSEPELPAARTTTPPPEAPRPHAPSGLASALKTFVGVVFVAAAAAGVAWSARRHVMSSRRFAVTDIDVVGGERRTREAVIAESGLALG